MKRVSLNGSLVTNVSVVEMGVAAPVTDYVDVANAVRVGPYWTWNGSRTTPAFVYGAGPAADSLETRVAAMADSIPLPASAAPPAVALNSDQGSAPAYARADHTHQSRLQARRIQVTPDAQGRYVYTFPLPYDAGIVPVVQVTAETPAGVSYRNDASILQGSTTNTQVTILATRLAQTVTLSGVLTSLLGSVLTLFQPVTAAVWVNIHSRAPS